MSERSSRLGGWRLALRIARREALRHRGRSVLVLIMIALPVLAVTTADILLNTQDVSSVESIDRRMGAAQARIGVGSIPVVQVADPDAASFGTDEAVPRREPLSGKELSAALDGAPVTEYREFGSLLLESGDRAVFTSASEVDMTDPLAAGLYELSSGRFASTTDEVAVNQALLDEGYAVGERLVAVAEDGQTVVDPIIVGIAESTSVRGQPQAVGLPGSLEVQPGGGGTGTRTWLVGGDAVDWAQVRELNLLGASVLSRAVLNDPPREDQLDPAAAGASEGISEETVATIVLIVVMALIEVVLLAGPAFAVGARRQSRSLALIAAAGGTPAQSRRVILAGGVVLGGVASVAGVVLGVGLAVILTPVLQARSSSVFGPFEVAWWQILCVGVFGLISALGAAVVPAWLTARQNVVAVLAGRRGDGRPSLRSPLVGVALLGAGVAGAAYGAVAETQFAIAGSAVLAVLGMILLVPVVVVGMAALSRRLPLTLRFAVRDAARHRSRTVPAVAAVAATVAGVVTLGIALTSDEAQNEGSYRATLPPGVGLASDFGATTDWAAFREVLTRGAPGAEVSDVRGVPAQDSGDEFTDVVVRAPGQGSLLDAFGGSLSTTVLVSDDGIPPVITGLSDSARDRAEAALREGRAVAFSSRPAEVDRLRVVLTTYGPNGPVGEPLRARVPGLAVTLDDDVIGAEAQAVLPTALAEEIGLPVGVVGLTVSGTELSADAERDLTEALSGVSATSSFYVENGYQADEQTLIIQLILLALGAVLMLGGTLTATFLALSDAKPDLATLAAVGATPRTRRSVAASYAVVVGFAGAILGAGVGFIPGIAITYPLTRDFTGDPSAPSHYLDIPWLLIVSLVIVLPLLTAAVMWLSARSRLPLAARLD